MINPLPPLLTERLLIDLLPDFSGERAIVVSPGRGQVADKLCAEQRFDQVRAWYLDRFAATQTEQSLEQDVQVVCSPDLPEEDVELVAMPVLKKGEAELTRDVMQQAHQRLIDGGHLIVSVDNPKDRWLHEQMQSMFDKVTCERGQQGCAYWAKKRGELKKVKDFNCLYKFRDETGRLFEVMSRPGVFSHRRLDPGARQLMLSADIGQADRVLDLGCGAGAVALAAAARTTASVYGVDSNARAVQCLERGAELNSLENIVAIQNADGQLELPGPVDLALANPPYFGDHQISRHFVQTSLNHLRSGGALLVVTKQPRWYGDYFEGRLEDVAVIESSRYWIVCGCKS